MKTQSRGHILWKLFLENYTYWESFRERPSGNDTPGEQGGSNDEVYMILGDFDKMYRGFGTLSEGRKGHNEAATGFYKFL